MPDQEPHLVGYARCSTVMQDLTVQRTALAALGVPEDRIFLDEGFTGSNRKRPGLDLALAAVRKGDTLITPKLDRLARSVPDARDIIQGLTIAGSSSRWARRCTTGMTRWPRCSSSCWPCSPSSSST